MGLFRIDVGIAIRDLGGAGPVYERIQIAYARPADAHIVGKAEIRSLAEIVLQAQIRDQIVVMSVVGCAVGIFHIEPGVFITQSSLE